MKDSTKTALRQHFSATHIAYMALFTALAYVVTFLEFPIFPATPFLKLDFANFFFMIEGFLFGPVESVVSIAIKELLCFTKSSSGGVGELANFLMSAAYILIPSIVYRFRKGQGWVALYLVFACLMQTGVSLPVNRYINYPFFVGEGAAELFASTWYYVLAFNAIKSVLITLIVCLAYKPLSRLIKATRAGAERLAKKRKAERAKQKEEAKRKKEERKRGDKAQDGEGDGRES